MSLSAKLVAAFGLSVAVPLLLAAGAVWSSSSIEGALTRFDRSEQQLRTLERLATKLQKRHAALNRYVYSGEEDSRREAAWTGAEVRGLVTNLIYETAAQADRSSIDPDERTREQEQLGRLEAFRDRLDELDSAWWALVEESGASPAERGREMFEESCDKPLKFDLLPKIDGMIQAERADVQVNRERVKELSSAVRVGAWAASIGAVAVAALAVLLLRRSVAALHQSHLAEVAANETKTMFLANMSHEICTPLGGILGFAQLLATQKGDISDPETQSFIATIESCGQHLLELINDILDLTKVETGGVECEFAPCAALPIYEDVIAVLSSRASVKSITLDFRWTGPLPGLITTDQGRLKQILLNLVGNAVKFTEVGGVLVEARVERRGANWHLLTDVIDTGIGIASEQLEVVFEPFRQADSSLTREYEGTGLGLAISKRLAKMLGGDIRVESTLGEGTTFHVDVDAGPVDESVMVASRFSEGFSEPSVKGGEFGVLAKTL